jgi:cytidyltransferase-like protein
MWPIDRKIRVAVNGCFDLFHKAHENLIHRALFLANKGWVLILLDTDERVQKLKGLGRPVDNIEMRRKSIEASIERWESIDTYSPKIIFATFSSSEELKTELNTFCPDMIIKGNDYPDVSKITGYPEHPILIVPRGIDENGEDISSTKGYKTKCAMET